ncbi:MAG TPA: TlpA disulfide reductase family protein [Cyclobacteriaceae bacterium]|nr:TlpA family protein disulfide reductase [Cyclobacteriaceae bacterium]MCB0498729.1 TlpA family protein disulfide reductase [Cyclobacteriaceae bacterium]MCB9237759.1 TlpA family protein disulfide reductase [Flammeovirgaceae bacterium]MCW5903120.1 TlpA family protein disulfide reductase [Cyclobacteriaceae bacterium]HOO11053.1 TlpA disulfide reductase family protein [Cyclobacteriaceae bacterium]
MKVLALTFILVAGGGSLYAQSPETIKIEGLQVILEGRSGKIQVVNFWATWCAPCVKELPLLERLNGTRSDVEVSLVSVDLDRDPNPDKIHRYVERKRLRSKIYILDERGPGTWIGKIDKGWSGAIPATLVVNPRNGKRRFVEGQLQEGEIEDIIEEVK